MLIEDIERYDSLAVQKRKYRVESSGIDEMMVIFRSQAGVKLRMGHPGWTLGLWDFEVTSAKRASKKGGGSLGGLVTAACVEK